MSYEEGAVKYFLSTFKNPVMFTSMYVFGGAVIVILKVSYFYILTLLGNLSSEEFISVVLSTAVSQLLPLLTLPPPTILDIISTVLLNVIVGAAVASLKWYIAVAVLRNR